MSRTLHSLVREFMAGQAYRANPPPTPMVPVRQFLLAYQGGDNDISHFSEEEWFDALRDDFGIDGDFVGDALEEVAGWGVVDSGPDER